MQKRLVFRVKRYSLSKLCKKQDVFGAEWLAVKVEHVRKLESTEMRMLHMICGIYI